MLRSMVVFHDSAAAFLGAVGAPLQAEEARHSLLLGLATALARGSIDPAAPPVLASLGGAGDLRGAALRIPPGPACLHAVDAGAAHALAEALFERDPSCTGVVGAPPGPRCFTERWTARAGRFSSLVMVQKLYELTRVIPPAPAAPGAMRQAGIADLDLVASWNHAFAGEAVPHEERGPEAARAIASRRIHAGELYLWETGGAVVAMGAFARETATGITINTVYTPPAERAHGYASTLVAAMSALALSRGKRACFLYADATNRTSNDIYRKIGYREVCASEYWAF